MADTRSPQEIEREIERERAELSATLDTLTDKFSVDRAVRTSQDYLSQHGGELAANFARTVKETPTAAVLTAIGIGWMIWGNQRQKVVEYRDRDRSYTPPTGSRSYGSEDRSSYAGSSFRPGASPSYAASTSTGSTDYGSSGTGTATAYGSSGASGSSSYAGSTGSVDDDFESRVAMADARMRARATGTTGLVPDNDRYRYEGYDAERDTVSRDYGEGRSEDETSMLERISDQAQDLWHQTVDAVRGGYRSASGAVRGGYQSAYRSATELRNSLFEGTEKMDVAGRERVASARARAYQAQLKSQEYAHYGQERANQFFHEQPLVAGAIAMALGAVVGGLLPRTRREDEAFGAYRDQLFAEAESVFQDERMRAEAAARAALAEAGQIATEAKDSVLGKMPDGRETVHEAEDQARTAAQRVAEAARKGHDEGGGSSSSGTSASGGGSTTGSGSTASRTV